MARENWMFGQMRNYKSKAWNFIHSRVGRSQGLTRLYVALTLACSEYQNADFLKIANV